MKKAIIAALALGGAVLPTGAAFADETPRPPSDASQALSAVGATGAEAANEFGQAATTRPPGTGGAQAQVPQPSFNWLGGPASGLLDSPFT
ncbi:MAG: hypothetical protein ABS81_15390 [Pseudonocardia sp. SCN 72-86]|nr:MAG: hypothetical protein ABS81_15390 [Pseudonocardia sp. SCN 72-86]